MSATKGAFLAAFAIAALVIVWYLQPLPDVTNTVPSEVRSIAVLPLENLSRDPEQQYFADGMTATLIGDLGRIHELHVISRRSVLRYVNIDKSLPEIARELNVDAILEGAVIREEERVRIHLQLIDGLNCGASAMRVCLLMCLHCRVMSRERVAKQVRIELSPEEQQALQVTHTVNAQAFDAYLRGLQVGIANLLSPLADGGNRRLSTSKTQWH